MKYSVTLNGGSCRIHFQSIPEIQTAAKFVFWLPGSFDSCDVGRGESLASVKFGQYLNNSIYIVYKKTADNNGQYIIYII